MLPPFTGPGSRVTLPPRVRTLSQEFFTSGTSIATHGTPNDEDAHVPLLLWGPAIRPGHYADFARVVTPAEVGPEEREVASGILVAAGFEEVSLRRCDIPMTMNSVDEAVELVMTVGPAGEILRLAGIFLDLNLSRDAR